MLTNISQKNPAVEQSDQCFLAYPVPRHTETRLWLFVRQNLLVGHRCPVKCDVTTPSAEGASGTAPVLNASHLADILNSSGAETSFCSN